MRSLRTCSHGSCDSCLRGNSDKVPSHRAAPSTTSPGELCSFDIWTCGIGHMNGGQRYVCGFHDHYSDLDKDYLLHRKSDAASAIKKFVAFCHGVLNAIHGGSSHFLCQISHLSLPFMV